MRTIFCLLRVRGSFFLVVAPMEIAKTNLLLSGLMSGVQVLQITDQCNADFLPWHNALLTTYF
jgi:hypothetical protein